MNMKRLVAVLTLAAALLATSLPALAAEAAPAPKVKESTQKILDLLGAEHTKQMMQNVALFKQAGLSFQESLTVPLRDPAKCKSEEQLRVLEGMYTFDSNYALVFGQKEAFQRAQQLLANEILEQLGLRDRMDVRNLPEDKLRQVLEDPYSDASRSIIVEHRMGEIRRLIIQADKDPELMALVLDGSYGAMIESLYVACSLSLTSDAGQEIVALFNEQANRLKTMSRALDAFAQDKTMAGILDIKGRQQLLQPVIALLDARKGNLGLSDAAEILATIKPERDRFALGCK